MNDLRAAAQQALEAMRCAVPTGKITLTDWYKSITTLRAALAEPQEPDSPERRCGGPGCDMRCCQPVQEPWEHLKQYGYAPGSYMSRCHICDKIAFGVDKRAITCRPCAEVRHAESEKAKPVQEPQGCDHCEHPLYAAVKCRVCGRVTEPTPPQRKPLPASEIVTMYDENPRGDSDMIAFARAIERAHGIGGQP